MKFLVLLLVASLAAIAAGSPTPKQKRSPDDVVLLYGGNRGSFVQGRSRFGSGFGAGGSSGFYRPGLFVELDDLFDDRRKRQAAAHSAGSHAANAAAGIRRQKRDADDDDDDDERFYFYQHRPLTYAVPAAPSVTYATVPAASSVTYAAVPTAPATAAVGTYVVPSVSVGGTATTTYSVPVAARTGSNFVTRYILVDRDDDKRKKRSPDFDFDDDDDVRYVVPTTYSASQVGTYPVSYVYDFDDK